jgi:hypothetical protein
MKPLAPPGAGPNGAKTFSIEAEILSMKISLCWMAFHYLKLEAFIRPIYHVIVLDSEI